MYLTKTYSLSPKKSAEIFCVFMLIVFLCSNFSFGQQRIRDSLVRLIKIDTKQHLTKNDSVQIDHLNQLSENLRFYKSDSLLKVAQRALRQSELSNYTAGYINALGNIGNYYSDKGNHLEAEKNFEKALELAIELNNSDLILEAQNQVANQYSFNREYAKALEKYLTAIELAEKVSNVEMLAKLNENIAILYADQKDYEQALFYFKIVKKLNDVNGDEISIACTNSNIAETYADMGNLEHAMYNITSSIAIFEKYELMDWLAYGYMVKGKTYLKQGKYKWALFWYNQSQSLYTKNVDDERSKIHLLNGIAEANMELKKDSISEKYALSALEISSKLKENEGFQKSAEILYKINKQRKDFVNALNYHELFQKLSDTIAKNGSKKNLLMLKTKVKHEQQKKSLIAANEKALAKQKTYIYATLAILLILVVITLLVTRSEKVQKRLNKELHTKKADLEKTEIELRAINETKDKMFSIIGHDLRGPIGAFQGLLQLLKNGEINKTEFLQFVPKLRTDIDNISFTLNNLLSWGQTQMNGTITQPSVVSLEHLVKDNINLLSEIAGNKSIKMISQLVENTLAWTDADQIDIVIRNLMSNALKFTPKNGMVTIHAQEKQNHWEVSVRDTGVGIDQETRDKIFSDNSNVTTYGTENEKGTGLGLSLCKEMVENNNGTIWVESVLRKGTCFYFTVPKATKKLKEAV